MNDIAGICAHWTSANHHSKIIWFFFVYASSRHMNFGEIRNTASLTFYILLRGAATTTICFCVVHWFVCVFVQQQNILIKTKVDVVSRSFISFHFILDFCSLEYGIQACEDIVQCLVVLCLLYSVYAWYARVCACIFCVDALSPFLPFLRSFFHPFYRIHKNSNTHKEMYTRTHVRINFRNINIHTHWHGRAHKHKHGIVYLIWIL